MTAIIKQKIVPHLWFDKEAKDAAEFYCSGFPDSRITNITTLHDTPSGDCEVVSFVLSGQSFYAILLSRYQKTSPYIFIHEAIVRAYVKTAAFKPIDDETLDQWKIINF